MFQLGVMDTKISLGVLGVMAILILIPDNADGRDMLLFEKPFFSSDIKNSKAFKEQFTVTGSDYPSGYTKSFNGSRYKFVDSCQGTNRHEAQSDCGRDSAHLVFIETKEEQEFLVKHASRDDKYWIGLFSPTRHLFWDNDKQVTFANLDQGNIDTYNDSTGCYKMSKTVGRYWIDSPCGDELGFICEFEGSGCPHDTNNIFNNSCYKFVYDSPSSRISAQENCKNISSHLVFIESKEENNFLIGRTQNDAEYWIGLHDRPQLFWDDGNQMTFGNIDQRKASTFNKRSGCYRMSNVGGNRLWLDRSCAHKYSYICEFKDNNCSSGSDGSFNQSCYQFVDTGNQVNRPAAQSYCERNSSHLVFIETRDEQEFLGSYAENTQYWIGLFSPKRHLFWDDDRQVTFANIDHRDQATYDNKTSCYKMATNNGRYWLDTVCKEEIGYICEFNGEVCPYDTTHKLNNSCYKIIDDYPASRVSAKLKCENDSSHLVFIESKDENDFLIGRVRNDTEYWIGLHDRPQLFWDDGKGMAYTNIDVSNHVTFDNSRSCYMISDHGQGHIWFDRPCRENSGYICEYDDSYFFYQQPDYPRDCAEVSVHCSSGNSSGIYIIKPDGYSKPFEVYCSNQISTGDWTVVQRHMDGSLKFDRNWEDYRHGFGFLSGEFYIGNEKLSYLTNQAVYELRIDMVLSNGSSFYVKYDSFRISDEWSQYALVKAEDFSGNSSCVVTTCPTDMVHESCSCQTSCRDAIGMTSCREVCVETCTPKRCFVTEDNFSILNGETYVNSDCTRRCTCNNDQLNCDSNYECSPNAACSVKNDVRQCYCNPGYEGDGETFTQITRDCNDVWTNVNTQDGVYSIRPSGWSGPSFNVFCNMSTDGGKWTVFQRRISGATNFYRNWTSYRDGFGEIRNEFWLGNEKLYYLTQQASYEVRVDYISSWGTSYYEKWSIFRIDNEINKYRVTNLTSRSGSGYSLSNIHNRAFSTYDQDNDERSSSDCAAGHRSGWWHGGYYYGWHYGYCFYFPEGSSHRKCSHGNLNGDYNGGNGQSIFDYHNYYHYHRCNIKYTEMKIRRVS